MTDKNLLLIESPNIVAVLPSFRDLSLKLTMKIYDNARADVDPLVQMSGFLDLFKELMDEKTFDKFQELTVEQASNFIAEWMNESMKPA
jgi:hypothetical protein